MQFLTKTIIEFDPDRFLFLIQFTTFNVGLVTSAAISLLRRTM